MKKAIQSFYFLLLTFFVFAGVAFADVNKGLCEEWCSQKSHLCTHCSKVATCGPGYHQVAAFKEPGKKWYACSGDEFNKVACNEWCDQNKPYCVKCSTHIGCGSGLQRIMGFTGTGLNWHACRKTFTTQKSDENKAECRAWCAAHSPCVKCDTRKYCGPGHKPMKHFAGLGKNWHACKKR